MAHTAHLDHTDLDAYNGAFCDLGFNWHWDAETYRELCGITEEKARLRRYIALHHAHLLTAYDADFLAEMILREKAQRHATLVATRAAGVPANLTCSGVVDG